MTYDADLAARVRDELGATPGVSERAMFGGLAFLVSGAMALAVSGEGGLMVRVDPGDQDELERADQVGAVVMRGRPMTGWVRVDGSALVTDDVLRSWVQRGLARVRSL